MNSTIFNWQVRWAQTCFFFSSCMVGDDWVRGGSGPGEFHWSQEGGGIQSWMAQSCHVHSGWGCLCTRLRLSIFVVLDVPPSSYIFRNANLLFYASSQILQRGVENLGRRLHHFLWVSSFCPITVLTLCLSYRVHMFDVNRQYSKSKKGIHYFKSIMIIIFYPKRIWQAPQGVGNRMPLSQFSHSFAPLWQA